MKMKIGGIAGVFVAIGIAMLISSCSFFTPFVSEGSVISPMSIGSAVSSDVTYYGEVNSSDQSSYYVVTVSMNHTYDISVSGMSYDVDLVVYSDSAFSTSIGSSSAAGTTTDSVTEVAEYVTLLYIEINPFTLSGTGFTLTVSDTDAVASEGSAASPVSIGNAVSGMVTYSGVANGIDSYYVVTVTSGETYGVSMTGLSSDIDLRLYTDSTFTTSVDTSTSSGTTSESVSGAATSSNLYIKADPFGSVSSTFTLTVESFPAVSNPVPADGASVTAGGSGQVLTVTVSGATGGTIYYDDDNTGIDYNVTATLSGSTLTATIAYVSGEMNNNGTNYWYVEATNTAGTTRFPTSGNMSFTVSP